MPSLHFLAPDFAMADALADLLARRRIGVTRGAAELGKGAAAFVAAVADLSHERAVIEAARAQGVRMVVLVKEGAERLDLTSDLGGRLLRIALPAASGRATSDAGLLMLADILAAPLRPMVACDPVTGGLLDLAARVARTDVTVFINGPTGSGKEVLARAVHAESRRADKPFIAINCAAIPENMLEAILFGHEKGAFTGAATANRGLIRAADGGTLMLDEISEMPLGLQSKLLRVIQERQVTPLGTATEVPVDIRIIATSNRDMPAEVRAGRFREDLYYRLNVFPLTTRPLAARAEDIPALAISLLRRHWPQGPLPMFSAQTLDLLAAQRWPGNVRELENVVQRALVLCDGQQITPDDIVIDSASGPVGAAALSGLRFAEAV
ncbi:sigma 54-interacting transcriptional regulator [Pseudotabrizicola algicola]|uniref:Nif-specific regulatory protein n=1 Tax=Pseudotabrizicola algicola TaxID=2709381 RepID=A0A6B3RIQ3_9RHOB|nr:sigma-54 dependent transcriptional regulator [Pseudotabrizicola algicola]NEX45291.1 sigma-54-dependent Fis family transcriptional regulator [Pseudotabrizicola algicola]